MELLVFGHAGARVLVFPTSMGRFYDWENRGMIATLGEQLERGWIQLYCLDSVDGESWYNEAIHPSERARRQVQYEQYVINEVLPLSRTRNENPFLMAVGASFGAYHAVNIAIRNPAVFNRVIGMSGLYDIRRFCDGYYTETIHSNNPIEYVRGLQDSHQLEMIRRLDMIIVIGAEDPNFENNREFSQSLWDKDIWHAFRVWDGWAHDWPWWQKMILRYIGGHD